MADLYPIKVTVNGKSHHCSLQPRTHLVDFLREDLGLKGSHLGCEHGVCGACLTLAVQADGGTVQTIEGVSQSGAIRDLQDAFVRRNALQCGFCTSGMLMAAKELVEQMPDANRAEVRDWISGNYCRCTGYQAIVDAICDVLQQRKEATA
jgi:aerobic-type carbon monoxide dehydrogenase small subunit (CoxS/CutS family)